jgi:hypothetical protein
VIKPLIVRRVFGASFKKKPYPMNFWRDVLKKALPDEFLAGRFKKKPYPVNFRRSD